MTFEVTILTTISNLKQLFFTFFKIGALTFGGGYAMMPIMRNEVVDKKHWVSDEDILKILIISETTPGVLAVNSATFIGYKIAGFKGSLVATIAVVLPSFFVISILFYALWQYRDETYVNYAFIGIKAGIAVLIFRAGLKLLKKMPKMWFSYVLIIFTIGLSLLTQISSIILILLGALFGLIYGSIFTIKEAQENVH
jgi:chromate transporter